ncbi:MAG: FAD-dependent oxidoreductase [Anaerolineales bacterium]
MTAKIAIIGAGVGGLTTGALLAQAGYDVTVLEAHVYPGGCAGTFYHGGYRFDAGATLAGGFQPGGPHHIVGQALGITWPVRRAEPAWITRLPDREIVRWGLEDRWEAEREAKLPAMRGFWRQQEAVADIVWRFAARVPPYPPANAGDVLRLASKIRPPMVPIAPLALMSFGQWLALNRIHDRASRAFIDGQLLISAQVTAERANALYGAIAMDLPRAGAMHIQDGIGALAKTLVEALRAQGGTYQQRQRVEKIMPLDDERYRLETNKGLALEADAIVANLTPWGLQDVLGEAAPANLRRETQQRGDTWGAFTIYLGVDADAVAGDCDHYQIISDYDAPPGEGNTVFISLNDPQDEGRAPAGQRTVTMSTHTNIARWFEVQAYGDAAYEARRADYQERMLRAAETVFPDIRRKANLIMNGTPQTFQFFTRRPRGMVGGFPQTSLLSARGPQTGLRNLWLVGDSVFPGQSTAGVTAGGMRVAADVARALGARDGAARHISLRPQPSRSVAGR